MKILYNLINKKILKKLFLLNKISHILLYAIIQTLTMINLLAKPNLTGYVFTLNPIMAGKTESIKNYVSMDGVNSLSDGFYAYIYIESYWFSPIKIGERYISGISDGERLVDYTPCLIPKYMAGYPVQFKITVDPTTMVDESDELDNSYTTSEFEKMQVQYPLPDLIITSIEAPSSANKNSSISLSCTVNNNGYENSNAFYLHIYISSDTFINTSDIKIGQYNFSNLSVNQNSTVIVSATLPVGIDGSYYVGAIIDPTNIINETNENNNTNYDTIIMNIVGLPNTATNFIGVVISTSSIQWSWTDNASNEQGYQVHDNLHNNLSSNLLQNTQSWIETNLNSNTIYSRHVYVYNTMGGIDSSSATICTLSLPPINLSNISNTDTEVTLFWNSQDGTRFAIERSTDSITFQKIIQWADSLSTTTYTDMGLMAETTYYYRIKAYNQIGIINDEPSKTILVMTAPVQPANFEGVAISTSSIQWSWTDNASNEQGYQVHDNLHNNLSSNLLQNTQSWIETNLNSNTIYSRHVYVYNTMGGIDSSSATICTLSLPPINLSNISNTDTEVTLFWNSQDGTRFAIERTTDNIAFYKITQWADSLSTTTYTNIGLMAETTYYYRIKAYNQIGIINDEPSNTILVMTAPDKPTNFDGVAISTSSIRWSWIDNASNEQGYQVHDNSHNNLSGSLLLNTQIWIETNLSPNTTYSRHVYVFNHASGCDSINNTKFTQANIPLLRIKSIQIDRITVFWEGNGTKYRVEKSSDVSGSPGVWWVLQDNLTATEKSDNLLSEGEIFWYRVRAYNGDGIITEGSNSVSNTPTPPEGKPEVSTDVGNKPPVGTVNFTKSKEIVFKWGQGTTSDPESGIAGYFLEIGSFAGGNDIFSGYVGNVTEYKIPNAEVGKKYFMRVKAKNAVGQYSDWSESSTGVQVMPQTYNYPNPARKEQGTKFRYELDRDYNNGKIKVYNLAGELIKEITIPAGKGLNDAPWDCRDSYNKTVEPGLYLYVLECDGNVISRQTLLVR